MIAAAKKKDEPASTPATAMNTTIERKSIALSLLVDSPLNPRKTFDKSRLEELGASMRAMGQLQPILVRPSRVKPGFYEIASGHRRRRAADIAEIESLEAIVRELTDEEIIVIGLTEDQNEPLPPLEEAAGYKALKDRGWTVEMIADKAGKSVAVVRKRLRLTHLHKDVQDAVRAKWLLPGAAALFARLESLDEQADVLVSFGRRTADNPIDAGDVDYAISQRMRELSEAVFDVKDAQLVAKAGACTTCPKRTFAQAKLFDEKPDDDDDRCTDGDCWASKLEAHSLVVIEKAKAKGQRVVEAKDAVKEKIVNEHGRLDHAYVPLDEKSWGADGKQTTKAKILEKAGVEVAPVTVVVQGIAQQVVPRKVFEKAERSLTKGNEGGGSSSSSKDREAYDDARRDVGALLLSTLRAVKTPDAATMRAAFILAAAHASFESIKRACLARSLMLINSSAYRAEQLVEFGDKYKLSAVHWLRLLVEVSFPISHINALPAAKEAVKLFGLNARDAIEKGSVSTGNEIRALQGLAPIGGPPSPSKPKVIARATSKKPKPKVAKKKPAKKAGRR